MQAYVLEVWQILLELSASLLFGLTLAGLMRHYLPHNLIRGHLSQPNFTSVSRASVIGVPMTLCSCGVIPTAMGLRDQGASKGATTAFMISTPQVGADSIMVSASMLGWPFAIFKVFAAFFSGLAGGMLVNRFTTHEAASQSESEQGIQIDSHGQRIIKAVDYAVFDLLGSIDLWLIGGILAAAAVTFALPADYFQGLSWTQGLAGMLLVLLISLPLYVCTTASVPIAASLVAAGMPAGTALVFLMAGPATNVATIGAVFRTLGLRVLLIYLGTVIVASISLGMGFDFVLGEVAAAEHAHHDHEHHTWWQLAAALLLIGLLVMLSGRRLMARYQAIGAANPAQGADMKLKVEGMTCPHCVASVKNSLENVEGVEEASPELSSGWVYIKGDKLDREALAESIHKAGYKVAE